MAKSIRSKWRRKCLREKRVRYGKKELASLLAVVQNEKDQVEVKDATEVVNAARKKTDQAATEAAEATPTTSEGLTSEAVGSTSLRALIKKYGNVPKWVHPRKVKKIQRKKKYSEGKMKHKK